MEIQTACRMAENLKLKKRRLEFINRELTIALEQFDFSDPFVATTSLAHARKRNKYEAQKL